MSLKLETRLYIMDEAMIKILKEEKQYNDINYYNMKVALEYKKSIYKTKMAICFCRSIP